MAIYKLTVNVPVVVTVARAYWQAGKEYQGKQMPDSCALWGKVDGGQTNDTIYLPIDVWNDLLALDFTEGTKDDGSKFLAPPVKDYQLRVAKMQGANDKYARVVVEPAEDGDMPFSATTPPAPAPTPPKPAPQKMVASPTGKPAVAKDVDMVPILCEQWARIFGLIYVKMSEHADATGQQFTVADVQSGAATVFIQLHRAHHS
jgi:hypothetical protein